MKSWVFSHQEVGVEPPGEADMRHLDASPRADSPWFFTLFLPRLSSKMVSILVTYCEAEMHTNVAVKIVTIPVNCYTTASKITTRLFIELVYPEILLLNEQNVPFEKSSTPKQEKTEEVSTSFQPSDRI